MPRALPVPIRERLVSRIRGGESIAAVAEDLAVSFWTARAIWRRVRDGGPEALVPDYGRCGRTGIRGPRVISRAAHLLRYRHPTWGAGLIRTILVDRYPDEPVADERTRRRWFAEAGLTRPGPPPRAAASPPATVMHQTRQLDAKERVPLADGTRVSWLVATDEASGAVLEPEVFPPWNTVGPERTRSALRELFADWRTPDGLRVDNGAPWGSSRDLPTDLALWLIGLGIAVPHNRPRRCEENGHVERSHGVLAARAEPRTRADAAALQAALTEACRIQRETYPAIRGQTRASVFPVPMAGGRPSDPATETDRFAEERVWSDLGARQWRRRVDKIGHISVSDRALGVGRPWKGQTVTVQFAAATQEWVIRADDGAESARHPAPEPSRDRILALDVTHRRQRAKPPAPTPEANPYAR